MTKLTREQLDEEESIGEKTIALGGEPRTAAQTWRALIAMARRALELEERIAKLSESLHNGSGNPYISGVDEHLMKHVSERLRKITE